MTALSLQRKEGASVGLGWGTQRGSGVVALRWRASATNRWVLSDAGTTATPDGTNPLILAAGDGMSDDKRYFEIRVGAGTIGNGQFGIKPASATGEQAFVGDATSPPVGWALAYFGSKVNTSYTAIGLSWAQNSTLRVAVDFNTSSIWFGVNGTWSGNPAAGTGAAFTNVTGPVTPAINLTNVPVALRTKLAQLEYIPPTGFNPWVF